MAVGLGLVLGKLGCVCWDLGAHSVMAHSKGNNRLH